MTTSSPSPLDRVEMALAAIAESQAASAARLNRIEQSTENSTARLDRIEQLTESNARAIAAHGEELRTSLAAHREELRTSLTAHQEELRTSIADVVSMRGCRNCGGARSAIWRSESSCRSWNGLRRERSAERLPKRRASKLSASTAGIRVLKPAIAVAMC